MVKTGVLKNILLKMAIYQYLMIHVKVGMEEFYIMKWGIITNQA